MKQSTWIWLILGGAVAAFIYYRSQQTPATPLSIYPSLAWTSMAATPGQQASTAVLPPTGQFTSVQQQEQSAVLAQCAGSSVCSVLASDTQLGL
jgi:hypothetical protein